MYVHIYVDVVGRSRSVSVLVCMDMWRPCTGVTVTDEGVHQDKDEEARPD
jgi:hypothetical protein